MGMCGGGWCRVVLLGRLVRGDICWGRGILLGRGRICWRKGMGRMRGDNWWCRGTGVLMKGKSMGGGKWWCSGIVEVRGGLCVIGGGILQDLGSSGYTEVVWR